MTNEMFKFWLDKPAPYCCRECVPEKFQHEGQLYKSEIYGEKCKVQEERGKS